MIREAYAAYAKANGPGGVNSLSERERNILRRYGGLHPYAVGGQNLQGRTAAPPMPHFAKGGKVANRDERFQELLRMESRMGGGRGGGIGGMNESARDRAARRLSQEEGRPSSTAYRPARTAVAKPAPKTGGTPPPARRGLPKTAPIPTPRPKTAAEPADDGRMPDVTIMGDPVGANYDTPTELTPDQITEQLKKNKKLQENLKKAGYDDGIDVPEANSPSYDAQGNPTGYARGGAIPDDNEPTWKKIVRGGRAKPDLTEFKRKAGTLPAETKSSQRKKPKNTAKPQKRDQKKSRPRTGGLPNTAPRPGQRPAPLGNDLPDTAPRPGERPRTGGDGLPPTAPTPTPRSSGIEHVQPLQTQPGLTVKRGYPHVAGTERPQQGPPFPGRGTPGLTAPINTGVVAPPPFRPAITQGAQPPPPPNARPAGNPFDAALAGLKPAPATGGVMSPIPGVAAPVSPGMDAPRGGTWSPPGAGPAAPAQPGQSAPGPSGGDGDTSISADDTPETLMQKLQALKARDLAWPFPTRDAVGAKQYAKGGAIPDDTPNFPEAEGASSGASSADTGPGAGQRGFNESVAEGRTANFNEVAQKAAPAVRTGIQGLSRIFGIDPTGQQGVPDEATAARQEDGIRRFASGEGAATDQEIQAIDATHGNDRIQADEGTKNLMRIDQVVNFWLQRGDKEKAEAAAASLLQAGAMQVRNAGTMAAAAFENYQQTGDVNALRHASQAVEQAYSYIPDGANLKIDIDPKTRQIVATTVDKDGKSQKQVVDPQAIPGLLKTAMDGSEYWSSTFQIGQPRLAEQQMQDTAALDRTKSNQAYDEYKFARGEDSKIAAEDRQAERWLWQQEYQTDAGRSPGERSTKAQQKFFESWGQDFAAATTPEEKKSLLEEGLGYRYESTRDRTEPVPEDEFRIVPESPNAAAFPAGSPDLAGLRDIARVIAQKEPTMDGTTAMEVTAALVTAPELDFNRDGTINVNGNSIVFNPQLLPQLGVLRNKYSQQQ